ncbi:unnamed protein product, partial [Iphiclides podalirius]
MESKLFYVPLVLFVFLQQGVDGHHGDVVMNKSKSRVAISQYHLNRFKRDSNRDVVAEAAPRPAQSNPCTYACGENADCNLKGSLIPVCSCPVNMTGNPYTYCFLLEASE